MATASEKSKKQNIFLLLHPIHRILVSLVAALIVFFIIRKTNFEHPLVITILWDVFAFFYILINWIVLVTRPQDEIIRVANKDDGSRSFVLVSILITSFASMSAVLMLMISKDHAGANQLFTLSVTVCGMMLSWIMVHTLFTFHYAHMYYEGNKTNGLDFPGDKKPDYLDFAYFSFVIGMTFQVSDVEIISTKMRRTVLAHGLLAFALNTFVVALTINLIAGLQN